jgi:hypothetical protein
MAPEAMIYKERFHVTGCGPATSQHNFIVGPLKAGGWFMSAFVPGTSQVDAQLFHDLAHRVVAIVALDRPGGVCANGGKVFQLMDTELIGRAPKADDKLAIWQERWKTQSCGENRNLLIDFTSAGAGGTDFSIKPEWKSAMTSGAAPHP